MGIDVRVKLQEARLIYEYNKSQGDESDDLNPGENSRGKRPTEDIHSEAHKRSPAIVAHPPILTRHPSPTTPVRGAATNALPKQSPAFAAHLPICARLLSPNPLSQSTVAAEAQRKRRPRQRTAMCKAGDVPRSFWVLPESRAALTTALEANLNDFVFKDISQLEQWSTLGRFESLLIDGDNEFEGGFVVEVDSAQAVEKLMSRPRLSEIIIMHSVDWKMIPAENLIAACQGTPTKVFAVVTSAEEAKAMFGMLQIGVDGCVLRSDEARQVAAYAALKRELVSHSSRPLSDLSYATVKAIRTVGVGERVCIDLCSLLKEDEGLLVGSSSQAMFLVLSEAAEVAYVPSRPFRVNAGPVHAYCLLPGGKTKYLCELTAGDEVLVVGNGGKTWKTAVVGRAKIETRPLLLVEATLTEGSDRCNVFVQNAETVRLATSSPDATYDMKSVTTLEIGDRLLVKTDRKARHIGIAIDEDLLEK